MIRTFERSREWRGLGELSELLDAFRKLCETRLDHSSLARPLASGTEGSTPYLVYSELAGTAMDAVMRQDGVRPVAEVMLRARQLADAIDGAASAGVHHGMLAPCDVILDGEQTGVTGFGLAQALIEAGIPAEGVSPYGSPQRLAGAPPTLADDVYSLAALTLELLIGTPKDPDQETRKLREAQGLPERRRLPRPAAHETRAFTTLAGVDAGKLRAAFAAAFSEEPGDRPSSAAEFVASFQDAFSIKREADEPAASRVAAVPPVSEAPEDPPADPAVDEPDRVSRKDADTPAPPPRSEHVPGEGRAARRRRARARRRERQAPNEPVIQEPPKSEPQERTPEIRVARPEPIADADVDLELSPDVAPVRALERARPPRAHAMRVVPSATPTQAGSRAFLVAAVIVVSFSAGFGGGFVAGHFSRPSIEAREANQPESVAPPPPTQAAVDPTPSGPTTQTVAPAPEVKVSSSEAVAPTAPIQRASPPVESGRLLVRSTPTGAAVVLDGRKRGITPLALRELALGAHTIEISHPRHNTRHQRVTLSERRPERSVDVRLRPASVPAPARPTAAADSTGSLQVVSRPSGAQVFVDDSLIGTTPFVVSDLAAGSRRLRIELSGYKVWMTSVQIEPSARFRVSATLEP